MSKEISNEEKKEEKIEIMNEKDSIKKDDNEEANKNDDKKKSEENYILKEEIIENKISTASPEPEKHEIIYQSIKPLKSGNIFENQTFEKIDIYDIDEKRPKTEEKKIFR